MANLLNLVMRGTILSSPWAQSLWFRKVSPGTIVSEADQASALADAWIDAYDPDFKNILSTTMQLNRVVVQGWDTPACFSDVSVAIAGLIGGDDMPAYVAMGFRQYRSNADFRAATHRLPGVLEANNSEGSWVYDANVTPTFMGLVQAHYKNPISATVGLVEYTFQPVLVRHSHKAGEVTTIFDPPQTNDVVSAAFYGLTSQVSRKRILGA